LLSVSFSYYKKHTRSWILKLKGKFGSGPVPVSGHGPGPSCVRIVTSAPPSVGIKTNLNTKGITWKKDEEMQIYCEMSGFCASFLVQKIAMAC